MKSIIEWHWMGKENIEASMGSCDEFATGNERNIRVERALNVR